MTDEQSAGRGEWSFSKSKILERRLAGNAKVLVIKSSD
jgi:hypothetical protein